MKTKDKKKTGALTEAKEREEPERREKEGKGKQRARETTPHTNTQPLHTPAHNTHDEHPHTGRNLKKRFSGVRVRKV